MEYFEKFDKFCRALGTGGAFLVVTGEGDKTNVMTIGWAQIGVIWGKPVMTVLVRPSRYTHELMGKAACFTVCVPPEGKMRKELAFCGSKSGRDHDKVKECGFSIKEGQAGTRYISGSELVYECRMLEHTEVQPAVLAQSVKDEFYKDGDFHTVCFGEITGVRGV